MPDIFHQFPINAPANKVFDAISTPEGLDAWWTLSSKGEPVAGTDYELFFGEGYDWRGRVTKSVSGKEFELEIHHSMEDWDSTRVGFELTQKDDKTEVRFSHTGWPQGNDHYHISNFCWAMYLRLMKKYVEDGDVVPYPDRLEA